MKKLTLLLFLLCSASLFAGTATRPANLSLGGIADWAILGGNIGSGTGAVPAPNGTGTYYMDISTPSAPLLYYSTDGASYTAITAGGGSGDVTTAQFTAHTASQTDPHGATMTISVGVQIGSGDADAFVARVATGAIRISSYTILVPEAATPTFGLTAGMLWYDSNTTKLRCYDGSSWNDLW